MSKIEIKNDVNEVDTTNYIKIKLSGSKKDTIYIAPSDKEFYEGQKIYIFTDNRKVTSATVVKGNYTDEKYKSENFKNINVVDQDYWSL